MHTRTSISFHLRCVSVPGRPLCYRSIVSFYLHSRFFHFTHLLSLQSPGSLLEVLEEKWHHFSPLLLLLLFLLLPAFCSSSVLPTRICNCMAGKPVKWHCVCRCCFLANAKSRVLNEPNTTGSTAHCKAYWPCHRPHLHCDLPSLSGSPLLVSLSFFYSLYCPSVSVFAYRIVFMHFYLFALPYRYICQGESIFDQSNIYQPSFSCSSLSPSLHLPPSPPPPFSFSPPIFRPSFCSLSVKCSVQTQIKLCNVNKGKQALASKQRWMRRRWHTKAMSERKKERKRE